jgi:hypothetical protein
MTSSSRHTILLSSMSCSGCDAVLLSTAGYIAALPNCFVAIEVYQLRPTTAPAPPAGC